MANESKTENIVREHFNQFKDDIVIEEKQSDNPRIANLLQKASKNSSENKGFPDFIVSFKTEPNLIGIVECKADIRKHEYPVDPDNSKRDAMAILDYAVDGARWYAGHLSTGFDVLAIGVSGETTDELRVSHELRLKGEKQIEPIFDDQLLPIEDYLHGYLKSPAKARQDYDSLISYAKKLNDTLHAGKITEHKRSVLISSILIALENEAFKRSYGVHRIPAALTNSLVDTVLSEIESAGIIGKKLNCVKSNVDFIRSHNALSEDVKFLKELIDSIDDNINDFIKTHRYVDVLSQFYIEFLRYSNSDKSLGIVLTPLHITELFSELAQVNKNSVVYDNCCGTGGFLISAMKRMIEDAKGDQENIKNIKGSQLHGTEQQPEIYTLAVSNMYIHQDGKTNILYGDCFKFVDEVKSKKPNIGLLNPPYKTKTDDTEELEFVKNNLECLVDGGTCIAILPMQCALAVSGKREILKRQILAKHTLEAVLSMPNELFSNSKTSVVTCVMIFTAHRPNPSHKETFFGYYKDDGFVKRKPKGRIDALGRWDEIKENWLTNYRNRTSVPGLSVTKVVTSKMEWCAEAYMETDYSTLSDSNFEDAVLEYVTFLHRNRLIN